MHGCVIYFLHFAWVHQLLYGTHSKEHVIIASDRNVDAVTFE